MFGRRLIAWPATWILYWAGDVVSRPLNWDCADSIADVIYPIYSWLMINSSKIQQWGGDDFGPWTRT